MYDKPNAVLILEYITTKSHIDEVFAISKLALGHFQQSHAIGHSY